MRPIGGLSFSLGGLPVLTVRVIMNSCMEEVLAFKCCSLPNQNLEMHVRNTGDRAVTVSPRLVLENASGSWECGHLFPPWEQHLTPGEAVAYYCSMPPLLWEQYETVSVFDKEGNAYRFPLKEITEYPA